MYENRKILIIRKDIELDINNLQIGKKGYYFQKPLSFKHEIYVKNNKS